MVDYRIFLRRSTDGMRGSIKRFSPPFSSGKNIGVFRWPSGKHFFNLLQLLLAECYILQATEIVL